MKIYRRSLILVFFIFIVVGCGSLDKARYELPSDWVKTSKTKNKNVYTKSCDSRLERDCPTIYVERGEIPAAYSNESLNYFIEDYINNLKGLTHSKIDFKKEQYKGLEMAVIYSYLEGAEFETIILIHQKEIVYFIYSAGKEFQANRSLFQEFWRKEIAW